MPTEFWRLHFDFDVLMACTCLYVSGPKNLYEQVRLRMKAVWDTSECTVHGGAPNR